MALNAHYDVVIIGGGLAGLSLSQQLVKNTDKQVLLLEKQAQIPSKRQKVGESLVQVGGYYFAKVLDMEEYLLREHYMKYNLRFYWESTERDNTSFEDYSQAYIRNFSNIPCYQLDRNKLEGELYRRNNLSPNFTSLLSVSKTDVDLADEGNHTVSFNVQDETVTVTAEWVIDTSGRNRTFAKQLDLKQETTINHGSSFYWVDGLVDIDKLTDLSPKEIRLNRNRYDQGHLPVWLATNHFMGEGFWFWVIPLQGMTSLGLVYDNRLIDGDEVSSPEKLQEWICERFPLFKRDLPNRRILDRGFYKSHAHGCAQTIDKRKWAMSGESGRFTDPLYSPGSDFIALHNTMIMDAILTDNPSDLAGKCHLYELLMRSLYDSLLPTFSTSYDALGDQEAFVIKYTWELSVYFAFFAFPMINDLSTDRRFIVSFLSKFSRLGKVNQNLQQFISDFYQWKKSNRVPNSEPIFHDFTSIGSLKTAESSFYEVGLTVDESKKVLSLQLDNLLELGLYMTTYIYSSVLEDSSVLANRSFIDQIDLHDLKFDPDAMKQTYDSCNPDGTPYEWSFDPDVMEHFRSNSQMMDVPAVTASGA
jgi:flavin-dependent dehydrogenase